MWLTLTDKNQKTQIAINFDRVNSINPHHSGEGTDILCGQGVGFLVAESFNDIIDRLVQLRN